MTGLLQGVAAGKVLGDRFAMSRSNSRMQAVQDAIDAGKYTNDAAGQAQLQTDLRNAQAPLSNRGMDDTYGEDQYSRLLDLEAPRRAAGGVQCPCVGAGRRRRVLAAAGLQRRTEWLRDEPARTRRPAGRHAGRPDVGPDHSRSQRDQPDGPDVADRHAAG